MKLIFFLSTIIFSALGFLSTAHAHELIQSGTASMFIHITPGDAPVAGEPAVVYLNIKNKEKGFSVDKCDCLLTIGKDEKTIIVQKLIPSVDPKDFGIVPLNFVFPSPGKYDLTVSGKPIVKGLFAPFELDYDKVVAPPNANSNQPMTQSRTGNIIEISLFIILGAVIVFYTFSFSSRK